MWNINEKKKKRSNLPCGPEVDYRQLGTDT